MSIILPIISSITSSIITSLIEPPLPFISEWTTDNPGTSNDNQITIPTEEGGTYDSTVNWGDGNIETNLTTFDDPRWTHTYSAPGTFTVKIAGIIKGFRFNNGGDKSKIIDISNWGILNVGNNATYFHGCNNLIGTATDTLDLTGTTNLLNMFRLCNLFNGKIGSWDVSLVNNMSGMFREAFSFNQDISSWNVSLVTTMLQMFFATAFNQNIGSWNVSLVTTMLQMFDGDVTLSTANYDALLIGWDGLASLQNGVSFSGGNSQFSAGTAATARANIISNFSWTITDGGQAP